MQEVTDPRGIVSRRLYNSLDRTTATISNYTGGAPAAQTDVTTLFSFDTAGRLASRTAVQATGTPSQTTGYVYGVSPATGSSIASTDLMAKTRYPDPVTGQPSATERDTYTSNALGERTSFTDRAGTTHTYAYDVKGCQTADAITALGTGVDGAVRQIESAYDALGRVTGVTSFHAPTAPDSSSLVEAFGEMLLNALVAVITDANLTNAWEVATLGIKAASKIVIKRVVVEAAVEVSVVQRRREEILDSCWWSLGRPVKGTGTFHWVETNKNVRLNVGLIDIDLTTLRGNPMNLDGIPIVDRQAWQQAAADLQAAVNTLNRNPEAVRNLVINELRKTFPDSVVKVPGK